MLSSELLVRNKIIYPSSFFNIEYLSLLSSLRKTRTTELPSKQNGSLRESTFSIRYGFCVLPV